MKLVSSPYLTIGFGAAALAVVVFGGVGLFRAARDAEVGSEPAADAIAYGGGRCGKLEGGVPLPCAGDNYEAFSAVACLTGRTYVHPLVREIVLDAYAVLAQKVPERRWQYGETGKPGGGELWPHKTHQNGLSVDFFFPVRDPRGRPATLSFSALNAFGYGIDFANDGTLGGLTIHWDDMARHLVALDRLARRRGALVKRIILAPPLRKRLFAEAPQVRRLARHFNANQVWVKHDEHYHVDFEIPRRLRRSLKCP